MLDIDMLIVYCYVVQSHHCRFVSFDASYFQETN